MVLGDPEQPPGSPESYARYCLFGIKK